MLGLAHMLRYKFGRRRGPVTDEERAEVEKQWPGFSVKCKNCGSERVDLSTSVGCSETSGIWGDVSLRCIDCGTSTTLWDAD